MMTHAKKLFNLNNLVFVIVIAAFVLKLMGTDADMFLNNIYGLFALAAGVLLAFNGKVTKGISFAVFFTLLLFASLTTETRLSDLIVSSVWFPYVSAYVGAKAIRWFGQKAENTDKQRNEEQG